MVQKQITDDIQALLDVLPPPIAQAVERVDNFDNLLEIILDLGRPPLALFVNGEVVLCENEITRQDIDSVVNKIGEFDADNRAGMERTLHCISAIRNRRGHIVGLTCRVGRAVYGTIDIIEDLIESGNSILILGKPGIGKTTMLREAARILAQKKRVVIVDTSNEIGGDGDVPHPAVGHARRMQVAKPSLQHEVMIEAVENHNPEVIVIDEIGRELEAVAARTIAERGVQLIGTAHGRTLENLLLNPTLSDLVGGIESVTLSDEEARRRGTQKTVLERRAPPTFDILIEIQERDRLVVHLDVASAVDALLRGMPLQAEVRYRDQNKEIHIEKPQAAPLPRSTAQGLRRSNGNNTASRPTKTYTQNGTAQYLTGQSEEQAYLPDSLYGRLDPVRIFPYGVARNRLTQAAKRLGVPVLVVHDIGEAQIVMTLRAYYRNRQQTITDAEHRGLPIYVLRSNTVSQIENSLAEIFNLASQPQQNNWEETTVQTQAAIEAVLNGRRWVDLPPAPATIRRIQHELARQAQLISHSYGKEPNRRVRIFRE
ncbi:MAG: AAA family ATPase [Anaerolineae bacterium]|nr:AAA family ATPase [Anaerolineae bacterium]